MNKFGKGENLSSSNMLNTLLNSIDALLYVSDVRTDEVLFINDRIKEHFGLGDEALGNICWKVFQTGLKKRCDYCPLHHLPVDSDEALVWEARNSVTGRVYKNTSRMIEWSDGRRVHLMHSTDVTDIILTEISLEKRLRQQELMSSISQSFTTTRNTHLLIYEALQMAAGFMDVNQAFLSKYQHDEGCLECLYEWCDEDAQPYLGRKDKWPISADMEIYKDLTINGYAAINDYSLLTHPNFKAVSSYDLCAFLNIPIEVSGTFWGVIGFIINKHTYNWSESDIYLGKMIAGVFSGVVSRNIAEQELLKTKELAEQASCAKGEFLSRMSHEMRTPMNAIIGMTQIAKNADDLQKKEYCLERIDNAARHLLGLINDILDMSKIEANKLELSLAAFNFENMLKNITDVLSFRIEEKNQHLIVNINKNISPVFIGDEMRLSQVITNLLSNAVKFTPEGGVITINIHNVDRTENLSTLLIEVADNGIGIAKEQQSRLFTAFEQADGSIARKYGGTGLGLNISKGIVELMGGKIWVESEVGQGSKFSFIVKMKIDKDIPHQTLSGLIDKNSMRILAIQGIPEVKDYLLRVMPALGLSCDVAGSKSAAIELIRQKKDDSYNIFLIDWMTPDLNVIELIQKIRRIHPDNKVIVMISQTEWNAIEKNTSMSGVDKFIFKPLFPSTIIDAINECMGVLPSVEKPQNIPGAYNFRDHTLLVAEDVEINREIIAELLKDTLVSIEFAQNGEQALSMFLNDTDRYNLILMDIQMPEMDGYEAAQKIRALSGFKAKSIPIIAMTANVFREDIEKCIKTGMNDHIGKPLNIKELLYKLDKYLKPAHKIS